MTSVQTVRSFPWAEPVRTTEEAFQLAFAGGVWEDVRFEEGGGAVVSRQALLQWIDTDLLGGPDPFAASGGRVPLPWPGDGGPDQLPPGSWVAYSRRQLCLLAAKSLLGAGTDGYANGLLRYLGTPAAGSTPAQGDFGRGLFLLLAACAADPTLAAGAQGPLVVVAKASASPDVATVRAASAGAALSQAGLRVCQYADGAPPVAGVDAVPAEGCQGPTAQGPGRDFMTGGLRGQALQDISAAWLGGYIWGNAIGIGGGQDERLMVYMPEVFILSFFLSESPGNDPQQRNTPQLRQPAWILGARRIMVGLDGTARFNAPPRVNPKVPTTSDLVEVTLQEKTFQVSNSAPFLAFMSENQDYEMSDGCAGLPPKDPACARGCRTRAARTNRLDWQRAADPSCPFAFEKQVRAWYGAVALSSYAVDVRAALRSVVSSLGTGPWLSGLWWGDSQLGFLAMWLGHAAAAGTWGNQAAPLPLDYYIYAAFTENPGNQCYVHSGDSCKACLQSCGVPPPTAYWLPGFAYTGAPPGYEGWDPPPPPAKACVDDASSCGARGIADVVAAFGGGPAGALWEAAERALGGAAGPARVGTNVFDALLPPRGGGAAEVRE